MYKIDRPRNSDWWIRRFVTMLIKIILISNFLLVSSYNIDANYPLLYPNGATNAEQYSRTRFDRGYFGYSVLLHYDSQRNTSW